MKKTHLYGAVAATMLLAPVTANVLAEENDSLSEATEAQGAEEFSDSVVLPPQDGEGNPADTGTGGEGEGQLGEGDTDPGTLDGTTPEVIAPKENPMDVPNLNPVITEEKKENQGQSVEAFVEMNAKGTPLFQLGKGTEEDPYQISSATELDSIRYDLNAHYVQTGNIDLSDRVWTPIGAPTNNEAWEADAFKGVFDGGNFKISGLNIVADKERNQNQWYGLFAHNQGILKNIILENVNIKVDTHDCLFEPDRYVNKTVYVGALTGVDMGGTIDHCQVSGNIEVDLSGNEHPYHGYIGGIVGLSTPKDFVANCQNLANIKVRQDKYNGIITTYTGGIVGYFGKNVEGGELTIPLKNCINKGNIALENFTSYSYSGGIAGYLAGNCENLINYGFIQLTNNYDEKYSSNIAIGSIIGQFNSAYENGNSTVFYPSVAKNIVNFGNMDIVFPSLAESGLKNNLFQVNGLIGNMTTDKNEIKNGYNLAEWINIRRLQKDGKIVNVDTEKYPVYRITSMHREMQTTPVDPSLWDVVKITNCYAADDLKLNGVLYTTQIGSSLENGASLSRKELEKLVESQFPNIEIDKPSQPIKTEAVFVKDNYEVKAESKEDLTGLEIVIEKVETNNNFGLSSDYQTIGFDIHFENEKGEEVTRTGKFTVLLPIPQQFVGKKLALYHISNAGVRSEIPFKITSDQKIEFETSMFSLFVIGTVGDAGNQPQVPVDSNPSTNQKPSESITNVQQVSTSRVIRVEEQPLYGSLKTGIGSNQSESVTSHSADTGVSLNLKATLASFVLSGFGILGFLKKRREAK